MARIVLLGATGYTGRLIAERLVAGGSSPVLAGRSAAALDALARDLGGASDTAVVALDRPQTIMDLLDPGDVLATTVGAFLKRGDVAVSAALERRAHYLDITGETPFVRRVFERAAHATDSAFLPAMGFNYAPGNLAGALALERTDGAARRLEIGYFTTGEGQGALSGGTLASAPGMLTSSNSVWRGGGLRQERCGARVRSFAVDGRRVPAMTLGSSECLTLPRLFPELDTIDVYQGGLGPATPLVAQVSRLAAIPGAARTLEALSGLVIKGSTGGPDAATRSTAGCYVLAVAFDRAGQQIDEVVLRGPNLYDVTAELMAWGAERCAAGDLRGAGPMGPVEAFGLDELHAACASMRLRDETRVDVYPKDTAGSRDVFQP